MEKTVLVRLRAELGRYKADLGEGATATRTFGRELTGAGKTARADLDQIGRGATTMGVAVAAGIGVAIGATMGFDKQLSELGAVSSATADEMIQLRDAALEAGAKTAYSASEAALAQTELAKAGVATADILGGALTGALDLAAAGGLELGRAAEIAAGAMGTFDLAGRDVTHIADVLAAGANKSAADVDELAMAMSQSGLVASQYGLDLEDTVGVLAMFAQNQLRGSDAGTSFKTMLQRLTPTSKEAADKMAELGIKMFDAEGNFIGIDAAAGELQKGLSGLTQEQRNTAMATIFGSDAVRAATILYEEGAAGVNEWVSKVDDAGFAGEVAGKRMDNLAGDLEELRGSIETALIEGGSQATTALRFLTQGATQAVNGFAELPGPLQGVGLGLGAVTGAGSLAIGALAFLGPRIREAKESLEGMGAAGEFTARNLGNIAKGIGLVGGVMSVIAAWEGGMASARARADDLTESWESLAYNASNTESYDNFVNAMIEVNAQFGEWSDKAANAKNPFHQAELQQTADTLQDLREQMNFDADAAKNLAEALGITRDSAIEFVLAQKEANPEAFTGNLGATTQALLDNYYATRTGTEGTHALEAGMETLGSEVASVEDQVAAFNDTLEALYNQLYGIEEAADAFQRSANDLPDILRSARDEGLGLNEVLHGQSNAAIDVREHLRGMVEDGAALIAEWQEQGATGDVLSGKIDGLSQSFREQMEAAGLPGPVVDHYLGLLGRIPRTKNTAVNVSTAAAITNVDRLIARLGVVQGMAVAASGYGILYGVPGGSDIGGPVSRNRNRRPGPTDTVPMMLGADEYVLRGAAVRQLGIPALDALNAGMVPASLTPSYIGHGGGGGSMIFSPNVVIHAGMGTDTYELGRVVRDSLEELYRRNGTGTRAVL